MLKRIAPFRQLAATSPPSIKLYQNTSEIKQNKKMNEISFIIP